MAKKTSMSEQKAKSKDGGKLASDLLDYPKRWFTSRGAKQVIEEHEKQYTAEAFIEAARKLIWLRDKADSLIDAIDEKMYPGDDSEPAKIDFEDEEA